MSGRVLGSLRGYFLGTTIVAGFNAVVVAIGAWILGVPLIGRSSRRHPIGDISWTSAVWDSAARRSLSGRSAADCRASWRRSPPVVPSGLGQHVQQVVRRLPLAMGAALGIHPLAVLIVTIAGGALFGTIGLILAAPLTSAVVKISADLGRARAEAMPAAGEPSPAEAAPASSVPQGEITARPAELRSGLGLPRSVEKRIELWRRRHRAGRSCADVVGRLVDGVLAAWSSCVPAAGSRCRGPPGPG